MSDFIAETNPDLIGKQEFLDEIEKRVKREYSGKFENSNRMNANTVESGGRVRRTSGSKTYNDLPAEARQACDRFARRGQCTREQYLATYEWE
jgi:hypothetical protein